MHPGRLLGPRAIAIATAIAASGCTVTAPLLGAGPARAGDVRLLDDALTAARVAGYRPIEIDPEHGRFVVIAHSDQSGRTRFGIQCFQDGFLSVVPRGPTIDPEGRRFRMPAGLREEYAALAQDLDHVTRVRP